MWLLGFWVVLACAPWVVKEDHCIDVDEVHTYCTIWPPHCNLYRGPVILPKPKMCHRLLLCTVPTTSIDDAALLVLLLLGAVSSSLLDGHICAPSRCPAPRQREHSQPVKVAQLC